MEDGLEVLGLEDVLGLVEVLGRGGSSMLTSVFRFLVSFLRYLDIVRGIEDHQQPIK